MALFDDLNAGLDDLRKRAKFSVPQADKINGCQLMVPIPPALIQLHDNQLIIDIRLAQDGTGFTMFSPIAVIHSTPGTTFWEALLRRQFQAGSMGRLTHGIADVGEQDVLMGIYHWLVDSITPPQFARLYQTYLTATFALVDEVNQLIPHAPGMRPLHKGRG